MNETKVLKMASKIGHLIGDDFNADEVFDILMITLLASLRSVSLHHGDDAATYHMEKVKHLMKTIDMEMIKVIREVNS